jgi:hypothetical protein
MIQNTNFYKYYSLHLELLESVSEELPCLCRRAGFWQGSVKGNTGYYKYTKIREIVNMENQNLSFIPKRKLPYLSITAGVLARERGKF